AQTGAMERSQSRVIRWVFHCDGKPIGSFRTVWRSAVKKAGLPGLRPHDLRRSAAREFVRTVTSESVAMALLGHRTRSMFDRYNITSTQDLAEAIVTAIPDDQPCWRCKSKASATCCLHQAARSRDSRLRARDA